MAGNKRIRRQRRRTVKKRKSAGFMGRMIALVLFAVIIIAVFTVSQNIYYYITGSRIDSSNPYPVKGVDVSEFQKEIDWKGLEKEGYRFAFIKATEGSSLTDSNFEYNWKEAGRTDMKISAYHFLSYDSSGVTQAENYINNVEKKRGMMPPAIDVEFYGIYNEKHPEHVKVYEVLDVMLELLEKRYDRKPIIYTNSYIYSSYISGRYDDYPVWISDPEISDTLPDGRDWLFCKYTFRGVSENIAGGEKYVDLNVFNGSEWEFRKYSGR